MKSSLTTKLYLMNMINELFRTNVNYFFMRVFIKKTHEYTKYHFLKKKDFGEEYLQIVCECLNIGDDKVNYEIITYMKDDKNGFDTISSVIMNICEQYEMYAVSNKYGHAIIELSPMRNIKFKLLGCGEELNEDGFKQYCLDNKIRAFTYEPTKNKILTNLNLDYITNVLFEELNKKDVYSTTLLMNISDPVSPRTRRKFFTMKFIAVRCPDYKNKEHNDIITFIYKDSGSDKSYFIDYDKFLEQVPIQIKSFFDCLKKNTGCDKLKVKMEVQTDSNYKEIVIDENKKGEIIYVK